MQKIQSLIILISTLLTINSLAQDSEWPNKMLFNRIFENGQKISEFKLNKDEGNIYGKNAYLNKKNEKIFELVKYNPDKDKMLPYLTGNIKNLETNIRFQRDSTTFIYGMKFLWTANNLKSNSKQPAIVLETQITDFITEQIITIINIKFQNSNKEFYGWSEESFSEVIEDKDIVLPQVLKVKRVSYSLDNFDGIKNPEDKITYALWTKNGFMRFAKNGLKDNIVFTELIDSTKVKYTSTMIYKDSYDKKRMYMNNYQDVNYNIYVSTLDIVPFPVHSENPILPVGSIIVWEKSKAAEEYINMIIKLDFIGNYGFSDNELIDMEERVEVLAEIIYEFKKVIMERDI